MSKEEKSVVRVVRLITGGGDLDVIAGVTLLPKNKVRMENPLVIRFEVADNQQKLGFGVYLLPYMAGNVVELDEKRDVRFIVDPEEGILKHYNSVFSPIIRPDSGIVLPDGSK